MKVCGFTFVKNAIKFDWPVVEAITSILPVCDKFIVAVGDCEDDTRSLIESIDSNKIEIIDTVWEPIMNFPDNIFNKEANKAFDAIPDDYDWCFFINADEVIHEKYLPGINYSMKKYLAVEEVDGLIMHFIHFYGTFNYYADSRRWFKDEIRIIRNNKDIRSWYNARGFRWKNGKKLAGVIVDGMVNNYSWVRPPKLMMKVLVETKHLGSHNFRKNKRIAAEIENFAYEKDFDSLEIFREAHPKVMQTRINSINWTPKLSVKKKRFRVLYLLLYYFEKLFNYRPFERKHFIDLGEI